LEKVGKQHHNQENPKNYPNFKQDSRSVEYEVSG